MEVLAGCLPAPWDEALRARRRGEPGYEEELCRKGKKLFGELDDLEKLAKKCGGDDWPLRKVSGPRALVLAWNLVEPLKTAGVEDPKHAAKAVAGIHGPPPTYGGWRRDVAQAPIAAIGTAIDRPKHFGAANDPWKTPDPGAYVFVALPSPPWTEDTPLLGLPFTVADEAVAALKIDGLSVSYGTSGDEVAYESPEAAVDAARRWLDWSQEFGREVHPDTLWIQPSGTNEQVARLLEATLTEHGEPRFGSVVVAAEGSLLPWSATVDAQGVE